MTLLTILLVDMFILCDEHITISIIPSLYSMYNEGIVHLRHQTHLMKSQIVHNG